MSRRQSSQWQRSNLQLDLNFRFLLPRCTSSIHTTSISSHTGLHSRYFARISPLKSFLRSELFSMYMAYFHAAVISIWPKNKRMVQDTAVMLIRRQKLRADLRDTSWWSLVTVCKWALSRMTVLSPGGTHAQFNVSSYTSGASQSSPPDDFTLIWPISVLVRSKKWEQKHFYRCVGAFATTNNGKIC